MQLSNELIVEKRRLSVAVTLMSGVSMDEELFAQASERYLGDLEDAPEILNSSEVLLIHRALLERVRPL